MARGGRYNQPTYNEVPYNYGAVESVEGKYHIKIAGIGFMLTRDVFSGRHNYGRDQAPTFVNKFGAGDPTYRDSSFFPHWVQFNWRNGAKQDDWDDEGRYLTSKNINITEETKISLSKLLTSLQLVAGAGVDITCMAIDFSDSRKVFAGCSNGHVWRYATSWTDMGDVSAVGGGTAGRRINCLVFSKIGLNGARAAGSGQIYAGVGTPAGTGGKNAAQLYRYDGTWASAATFAGYDALTAMCEFNGYMYAALGGTAVIQSTNTANLATSWTTSKDIDYPGYIWSMVEYNQRLYAGGGHPEGSPTTYQLGTLWNFDGYLWSEVGPFNGTVIRSLRVFDNLLFIGTVHGQLYVYNRANIDLLYEMPTGNGIYDMVVYNDKLYMAVCYRETNGSENAVYVFDRAGTHRAHLDAAIVPNCLLVNGDDLWIGGKLNGNVYKIDSTHYNATGELQSSYYNANLPNIDKVWFDASVEMESLPAGGKVELYYKEDESDAAWTKIDETTETGKQLAVFALPEGTYSKKLSYKIVISCTDADKTPVVKKIIFRYIIQPNFKYLWKFKVACPDNIEWIDETSPVSFLTADTAEGASIITLNSAIGFPDPGGDKMYAVIEDEATGLKNEFYYTGVTGNTLTGCASVTDHLDVANKRMVVAIRGRHFHEKILELKQRKAIVKFVDIDSIIYRVIMHDYSEDGWVINSQAGLENEVAITLLEA